MIKPEGWHNWGKPEAETQSFFAEYGNTGVGAPTTNRVGWSHQLTLEESTAYSPEKVLGEWVSKFK